MSPRKVMSQAFLLTGAPGSGKTTAIRRILERISFEAGGFYTEEIRTGGRRKGFRLVTLEGERAVLAHVDIQGAPRISKYGVDVEALERVGVAALRRACAQKPLVVIDEIGPMEMLSQAFREAVVEALESDRVVLGSIVRRGRGFAQAVKSRPEVQVIEIHRSNRDRLVEDLAKQVEKILRERG